MFKLQPNPTFRARVAITVPGGKPVEVEFEFRHKTRDGLKAFFEGAQDRPDEELLSEIVCGWSGVDAEYSPEHLAELTQNYPAAAGEIVAAYAKALTAARLGN